MADMMSRRLTRRQVCNQALLTAAAGAGAVSGLAATGPAAARQATPGGGTLIFGYGQATSYVNTCLPKFSAGGTDIYLRRFVGSDLVTTNENFDQWLPDLAESWEFSGTTATFKLRQGVTWHDGVPFTAKDVLFTYRVMAHPNTADASYGYGGIAPLIVGVTEFREGTADTISGIQAPDDHTVVFEMISPAPESFLAALDWTVMLPEHVLGAVPEEQWKADGLCQTDYGLNSPIGTGPFRMTNYVVDQTVEYEPFDNYWRGKPLLDKLIYRPFADGQALAAALESGEVHIGNIAPSDYERFQQMEHLRVELRPGLASVAFYVNSRQFSPGVRQALLLSLDRATICQTIFYGVVEPPQATWIIPRYGVNPEIADFFAYDPERAKQLLADEGWDPNRKVRILVEEIDPATEPLYALVRSYWEAVGVQSEFQIVGTSAYTSYFTEPWNFDVVYSSAQWGTTPSDIRFSFWNPEGDTGIANDEAVALLDEIIVLEDQEAIKQGVWRLQAMAAEDAILLPVAQSPGIWVINTKVQGDIQPIYALWTSNYWGLEKVWVAD